MWNIVLNKQPEDITKLENYVKEYYELSIEKIVKYNEQPKFTIYFNYEEKKIVLLSLLNNNFFKLQIKDGKVIINSYLVKEELYKNYDVDFFYETQYFLKCINKNFDNLIDY